MSGNVYWHGTYRDFDKLKKNREGVLWLALSSDVAFQYGDVHWKPSDSRVKLWRVVLKPSAKIARLDDLSDPVVRELKEGVSMARAMTWGPISDESWSSFADFGILEGYRWTISFLKSKLDGVVVGDSTGGASNKHESLALFNMKAIQSSERVKERVGRIARMLLAKDKLREFSYGDLTRGRWSELMKEAQDKFGVAFSTENDDYFGEPFLVDTGSFGVDNKPYRILAQGYEAGGDWENAVIYFRCQVKDGYIDGMSGDKLFVVIPVQNNPNLYYSEEKGKYFAIHNNDADGPTSKEREEARQACKRELEAFLGAMVKKDMEAMERARESQPPKLSEDIGEVQKGTKVRKSRRGAKNLVAFVNVE